MRKVSFYMAHEGKSPEFANETDVVVIGSGAAGSATALTAAEEGLAVELFEKAGTLGGGTIYSYGGVWIGNNGLMQEAGISDSPDAVLRYYNFLNAGYCEPKHLETLIDFGPKALDFFRRVGIGFRIVVGAPDHYYPHAPGSVSGGRLLEPELFPAESLGEWQPHLGISPYVPLGVLWSEILSWGGFSRRDGWDRRLMSQRMENGDQRGFGMALAGHLLKGAIDRGVSVTTDARVDQLVGAEGRVQGVEVSVAGVSRTVRARRGVVIATGGYESNPELVRRFEAVPSWDSMFPASVTGDGLIMAVERGAALQRAPESLRFQLGYHIPVSGSEEVFRGAGIQELTAPHTIVVNQRGQRFADESAFQYMVSRLKEFDADTHAYPNMPCFLILDSAFFERYGFAGEEAGTPAPAWLASAETVRHLARQVGIDSDGLERAVQEFNSHARKGLDPIYARGQQAFSSMLGGDHSGSNPNLAPLDQPPFYAVALTPTGVSSTGIVTEPDGAVTHVRGGAIPGLYANGNAAITQEWGPGYQGGLSLARALTMGYLIGTTLSRVKGAT